MTRTIKFQDLKPEPKLRSLLNEAHDRVMDSGWYIGGVEVEAFEQAWADYCGAKYCVSVSSGFSALQLALLALGVGREDQVVVPHQTCYPTWAAVRAVGADPNPRMPAMIGWDKAQIEVHLYGIIHVRFPPPGVPLVEDCAQAHGATIFGKKAGNRGVMGCWSFYPTKNLGAYGDAGAVTTNEVDLYEKLKELRQYGGADIGINGRCDPLQAAFLLAKLPYLDTWNETRRQHAARYLDGLKGIDDILLPYVPEGSNPCWHQFVIRSKYRDKLRTYLANNNVETMIHYPVPPYKVMGMACDAPLADDWAASVLSLPVAPHLSDDDIEYVIQVIKRGAEAKWQ